MNDSPDNIRPETSDVKWPGEEDRSLPEQPIQAEAAAEFASRHGDELEEPPPPQSRLWWNVFAGGVIAVVCIVGLLAFLGYRESRETFTEAGRHLEELQSAASGLKLLGPESEEGLGKLGRELESLSFGDFVRHLGSVLKGGAGIFGDIQGVAGSATLLVEELGFLEQNAIPLAFGGGGEEIIVHLENVKNLLSDTAARSVRIASTASDIREFLPLDSSILLPLQFDLNRLAQFADPLLLWLKDEKPHHLLVLFQNPSEIRPGGGFLGSYAEVLIRRGNIEEVNVRDVNEVDRGLKENIIPPKPVQLIATRWKTADANWFFDFSDSAEKVLSFMEKSDLYRASSTTFDGVLAVSPRVISDLLRRSGPIELPEYKVTIDETNFLFEIQKQVQQGQARRSSYPKQILEKLTPLLLEKVVAKDGSGELFRAFQEWIEKKDLMAYFKNPDFEEFFDYYGATGEVYDLPEGFEGDYLAIVDANIGGGKTDIFVKQKITLESQINLDGTVTNHLAVTRRHEGNKSAFSWYRAPSQVYLKVFTPPGSKLENFTGGIKKTITPPINYAKSGYASDSLLQQIESTEEQFFSYPLARGYTESGKNVFATWVRVDAGKTATTTFDYSHRLFLPPRNSLAYQFVFEKQAGTSREYQFIVSAPVGYRFRENQLPIYEYRSSDPPGRLVLTLTLERF
ncbi:DUF4012 domain-containing protein [Candidatus Parcubacteria bacterium]|nr:MAG: DUF4012 domain-containing protein [Candidatus Parcubacteria bacterium]